MAYFGGTVSQRPWPRLDIRFALLLLLSLAGIITALVLAKESILAQISQMLNRPTTLATATAEAAESPMASLNLAAVAPAQAAVTVKTTDVLVATETIKSGMRLRPAMFRLETRSTDNNLSERALTNLNEIEGAYTRISIGEGSPLLKDHVAPLSAAADIIERIPPGYRAVAIPVNIVTGVEGWVQAGARVDVVWTTEIKGKLVTTTLVENAQVLSAERRLESQGGSDEKDDSAQRPVPSHATLLVTTNDSQRLQLAKNSGSLSLSLRGDKDVDPGNAATLSTDSIIKNRTNQNPFGMQGKVTFGGQQYVLSGSSLVPQHQYDAKAKMKEASDSQ